MSIEQIIRAWRADEDGWEVPALTSPVGPELTEEELAAEIALTTRRVGISRSVLIPVLPPA